MSARGVKVLADADVLIDALRGVDPALDRLRTALAVDGLFGTTVTRFEVLSGMRTGEERGTLRLLDAMRWLSVDRAVADRAGQLARRHRRQHPGVGLADYVVAATVEITGLKLLTRNVRDFPMLRGLRPAY